MTARHLEARGWTDEGGGDWSRTDADGTRWTLCPDRPGVYTLAMRYREHLLVSQHPDPLTAAAHYDDMVAMLTARTMAAYQAAVDYPQPVDDGQEAMF